MKLIVGAVVVALLVGCATSPVPSDQATLAPAARVISYQRAIEGGGKIIVTRDSGYAGGGCYATVFLNGKPAARLDTKEKVVFQVPSGEWVIGAGLDGHGLCGINEERLETELVVKPGQEKKFRVFTSGDGSVGVKPTTF